MIHCNNFDFLRLLFAIFVIITHSYPLSGLAESDWLSQLTNGQISFSYLGVKGFFVISGFLIFQSLCRSKSLVDYFWKRVLRLFPALIVVLLLTLIFGFFVYNNKEVSYFNNPSVWSYLPNNLMLYKTQFTIPGIFDVNPYPQSINGSLWTIPYEFSLYILVAPLFFIRRMNKILIIALTLVFFILVITSFSINVQSKSWYAINNLQFLDLSGFFIAGSIIAAIELEKKKYFNILSYLSICIFIISLYFGFFQLLKLMLIPIITIWIGSSSTSYINQIGNKIGDLSYGIYIYSFPVQQTLVYYFGLDLIPLMMCSFLISSILAYFSWHLIESEALKFKKLFSNIPIPSLFKAKNELL